MEPNAEQNEQEKKGEGQEINISDKLIPEDMSDKSDKEMVIDELHKKVKLPSLRSFQGDMAQFIKDKNESVLSIAAKEKRRKDEKKREEEKLQAEHPKEARKQKKNGDSIEVNFAIILSSVMLLAGGGAASYFVYKAITTERQASPVIKNEIIPFNNYVNLANASKDTLSSELQNIAYQNGITSIILSDVNGKNISSPQDFFGLLGINPPATLVRTLKKDVLAIGTISTDGKASRFVILSVNDFGLAFASMLEWENTMPQDLSFMSGNWNGAEWKDLIVKNKDTRALMFPQGGSALAYTFLDKGTILIVSDVGSVGDIGAAFASRAFTR